MLTEGRNGVSSVRCDTARECEGGSGGEGGSSRRRGRCEGVEGGRTAGERRAMVMSECEAWEECQCQVW